MNKESEQRKMVNKNTNIRYGGYDNGKKLSIKGNVNNRMQLNRNRSKKMTYDKIDLQEL
jgi:hypothetical protein